MLTLHNDHLHVSVLDPVEDRDHFSTRFCTGGYVFQVTDANVGELLSGPTFPDEFHPEHGQGLPDAFSRIPLRQSSNPSRAEIIGVGRVNLNENTVLDWCRWETDVESKRVSFSTRQAVDEFSLKLDRTVSLHCRSVTTRLRLTNQSPISLPVSWYPHPFFPQPESNELCRIDVPFSFRENDGYRISENGFIARRYWPWETDYYLPLDHEARSPVTILQRHPKLGLASCSTDYVPRFFPIWANSNCISWEPYFETHVGAGQSVSWGLVYDF